MKSAAVLIACALPLAACGSKPQVNEKNASVEQVSEKVREASKEQGLINPGKWVSTVKIEEMSMPGMPLQAVAQMKKVIGGAHTSETCLTAEQAKQPKANFFSGNDQCRYDHFTMKGGTIDAEMHCTQRGSTQVMQMSGKYSSNSYTMHMKSRSEGGADKGMSMQMTVDAKRVGDCTGKET